MLKPKEVRYLELLEKIKTHEERLAAAIAENEILKPELAEAR